MTVFNKNKLLALVALGSASMLYAATPQQVISGREAKFKAMGKSFKAISDELRKDAPSLAIIRPNAKILALHGSQVSRWFPPQTGPESGVRTEASPNIWVKKDDFKMAAINVANATRTLNAAAVKGDLAVIASAAKGVGPTCKGCHDQFRVKLD